MQKLITAIFIATTCAGICHAKQATREQYDYMVFAINIDNNPEGCQKVAGG